MWSFVSLFQVTEGLAAVIVLLLFVVLIESSEVGFFESPLLRIHMRYPLSVLFTFLAVLGVLSFVLLGLCGMRRVCNVLDPGGWNVAQYPLNALQYIGGAAFGPGGLLGYGALALLTWAVTVVFLSLAAGLAKAVRLFALPSLLFLTTAVLLFDPQQMSRQAVNLASQFTFDGISLLSNWFLLTVSLSLTAFLAYKKPGTSKRTRSADANRGISR